MFTRNRLAFGWLLFSLIVLIPVSIFADAEPRHLFSEVTKEGEILSLAGESTPYTGILFSQHENGNLAQEFHVQAGRFKGVGKTWYPDGILMDETPFNAQGQIEGEAVGYYPSGKVKARVEFKAGKMNGQNTLLWEDGSPKAVGPMQDGQWHGEVKSWWSNGKQKAITTYRNGVQHGACREWHENGQLAMEGALVDGKPMGEIKTWHPNGQQASIVVFENDRLTRDSHWNDKGEVDNSQECFAIMRVIAEALKICTNDLPSDAGKPDLDDLVREHYLKIKPQCPDAGAYTLTEDKPRCSIHGLLPTK